MLSHWAIHKLKSLDHLRDNVHEINWIYNPQSEVDIRFIISELIRFYKRRDYQYRYYSSKDFDYIITTFDNCFYIGHRVKCSGCETHSYIMKLVGWTNIKIVSEIFKEHGYTGDVFNESGDLC